VTAARTAVLDASVLVRSIVEPQGRGARWVAAVDQGTVEGHTAVLAFTEVSNALLGYVRVGGLTREDAVSALEALADLPLQLHGGELAPAALGRALELGLSAYDGTYAALAESIDGLLVTADRRLAEAFARSELVD
jgi:predicted nucleic acid-binding protein